MYLLIFLLFIYLHPQYFVILLIIILILTLIQSALYVKELNKKDMQIREKIVEIDNLKEIVNERSKEE